MGGMEAHCHTLVGSLERAGHQVTLFAAAGSEARQLRPICDQPYEAVLPWAEWRDTDELADFQTEAFARAWKAILADDFDVVHNNSLSTDLAVWAARDGVPMVTSQHVPPFARMRRAVGAVKDRPGQIVTVTSRQQLGLWGDDRGRNMRVVHNGIDTGEWRSDETRHDRLLWFGRITETKGLRETVAAARMAGRKLDIVGSIEDRGYFDAHVAPFLGDRIRYLGHLSGKELRTTVSQALAVCVTPMWDEPFGLVAAEAMALGVPVIAFDRGAMREVLGPCGALVRGGDVDELADAMRRAEALDGDCCRDRIERLFSIEQMIDGYVAAYRDAIAGVQPAETAVTIAA